MNFTPEKISRPMNSFMLYKRDQKHAILAKYPGINFRDVSKIVADSWKNEDPDVKKKYSLLAAEESRAHKQRYPNYKYPSSIGKKKKKDLVSKFYIGSDASPEQLILHGNYLASEYTLPMDQSFPLEGYRQRSVKNPSLFQLNTLNIGQNLMAAIPNSPKDLFVGTIPVTNTLLSPISFSFERDPALTSFFSSWDFSQVSQGLNSGGDDSANGSIKNHQSIQSSLAAHLPGHGFSATL